MEIRFQTKEESNKLQKDAFLKLNGAERFYAFLDLCERISKFPTKAKKEANTNFQIVLKAKCNGKDLEGKH